MPLPPVWRGSALFYDRSGVGNHGYSLFGGIAAEMEVNGRRVELSVLDLNFCEVSCSLDERVYVFISNRFTISISYLALNPAEEIHTGIGRDGMALVRPPVCRFWGAACQQLTRIGTTSLSAPVQDLPTLL